MPTTTTTYSFNKPVVGADEDSWGGYLNGNWDSVDDLLDGTTPITGIDINSGTLDGVTIGGTTAGAGTFTTLTANTSITGTLATAAQPNITSVGTLTGLTVSASASLAGASTSADITFGDNDKAIFGAGSDLQIYHDGSNSYVQETGAGQLLLRGAAQVKIESSATDDIMVRANSGGSVDLFHAGSAKLATTSTGVDITGTLTSDGLTVEGTTAVPVIIDSNQTDTAIQFKNSGYDDAFIEYNDNNLFFYTDNKRFLSLANNGDISFYEDTGTTAKFFWDASAESLGIGTSSPSGRLSLQGAAGTNGKEQGILLKYSNGTEYGALGLNNSSGWPQLMARAGAGITFHTNSDLLTTNEAMRIDSSGNLLLGSSTYGGYGPLQVGSTSTTSTVIQMLSATNGYNTIHFGDATSGAGRYVGYIQYNNNDDAMLLATDSTEKMRIDSSGNVGIGTSSPSANLHIASTSPTFLLDDTDSNVVLRMLAGSTASYIQSGTDVVSDSAAPLVFGSIFNTTEWMRIASDGSVGIGTSSPLALLDIASSVNSTQVRIRNTSTGTASMLFQDSTSGTTTGDGLYVGRSTGVNYLWTYESEPLVLATNNSEAARIDASGNLLVGKTSSAFGTEGVEVRSDGLWVTRDSDTPVFFNRETTDGQILNFSKDTSTVGSIGTANSGDLYIGNDDTTLLFAGGSDAVLPRGTAGAARDNAIDLGASAHRFDDIYATNGTIQTSDANEKQDIAELSDAEQRVAVAAKGLLRKFRWKDAVAEKGDEARTHFGIIAQDLQAAFAAEGLDAGDYAMFIYTTWTDEETGEEKSRMGVRYSELLAFIIAAI